MKIRFPKVNDQPTSFHPILTAFLLLRRVKVNSIHSMPILHSGITKDGTPFIVLKNGRKFYSYLPTQKQRLYYRMFVNKRTKKVLKEDCINVAFDIYLRYFGRKQKNMGGFPENLIFWKKGIFFLRLARISVFM